MTAVRVEALLPEHAEQELGVYRSGIDEGNAAFETKVPDRAAFGQSGTARIAIRIPLSFRSGAL